MNIPSLGPKGEGWVVLQLVCLGLVAAAARLAPGTGIADDPGITMAAGALFLFAGGVLAAWGLVALRSGQALTSVPYPLAGGELVQSGPFRLVRHPIYGGLILVAAGLASFAASVPAFVATAALAVTLDLKRRREEIWLTERYSAYPAYRTRTRALIPFVF